MDQVFAWTAWASSADGFENFFSELSLKSIVAILGGLIRVLDAETKAREPYSTFISKMLTFCTPFLSQLDDGTYLTILVAASLLEDWAPEVHQLLALMVGEFERHLQGCHPSLLSAAATVTAKLRGDVRENLTRLIAQRLLDYNLETFSAEELAGVARLCNTPGATDVLYLLLVLQELAWASGEPAAQFLQADDEFLFAGFDGPTLTSAEMLPQEQASMKVPEAESTSEGRLKFMLKDPAYLPMSLTEDTSTDDVEPSIVILSEFSGCHNGTYDVAFEVNSPEAYELHKVQAEVLHNGDLVDRFQIVVEAGYEIPNTHSLQITNLKDGAYQVHFTIASLFSGSLRGAPVVHRFWRSEGALVDVPEPVKLTEDKLCSFSFSERPSTTGEKKLTCRKYATRTVTLSTFSGSDTGGGVSSRGSEDGA